MLIEFRLANFRSYAAEKRFSMVAGPGKELPTNTMTVAGLDHHASLRSAAIYGPNASGKSNLFHAFAFFRDYVLHSSDSRQEGDGVPVVPFLLDPTLARGPSEFEITFLLSGVRHQYGFVVSRDRVHEEWLIVYPKGKPQEWFHRTVGEDGKSAWVWSRTHFRGDKAQLAERTRDNALFLSVAAQWNHAQIKPVHDWFRTDLKVVHGQTRFMRYTKEQLLNNGRFREWVAKVLRAADTGIDRLVARERKGLKVYLDFTSDIPEEMRKYLADDFHNEFKVEVRTARRLPGTNEDINWDLSLESDGTQRLLELLGPIYDVLRKGAVLVMDELDTSLHAYITRAIVQLFHDPKTNPGNAQLVFTTHDTSLLDPTLFRRDQVWLTEKESAGQTDLYSLEDFKLRVGGPFQKGYLAGRYGGVPVLGEFEFPQTSKRSEEAELIAPEG